jgi:hypothetical protein
MLDRMRAVMCVLCLFVPMVASADPHPMASGATPSPATESTVAMTAETLTIDIGLRHADVTAAVTLENPGAATKLFVGFPCSKGDDVGHVDVPCKVKLAITANGKKVKVAKTKPTKTGGFWLWQMKMAAGEKVELVVKYKAPLLNDRYDTPGFGMGIFTYRLTTGARWAGAIGKLNITVNHLTEALWFVSPSGGKREPGRITWTLDNHEPTEEVVIIPQPMLASHLATALSVNTPAQARAKLDAGDYKKADIEKAITAMKEDVKRGTERWLKIISPLGGVGVPAQERVDATIGDSIRLLEAIALKAKR